MDLSEGKIRYYTKRILFSRMRLLLNNGFYGILLMHTRFRLSEEVMISGIGSQGNTYSITINPEILETIPDEELDFLLMHEILHAALRHDKRGKDLKPEKFNIACDIVVNSNILHSSGDDERSITLSVNGGVQEHTVNGKEGYHFTAEEVYQLLDLEFEKPIKGPGSGKSGGDSRNCRFDIHEERAGSVDRDLDEEKQLDEIWDNYLADACEAISIRDPHNKRGLIPELAYRMWTEMRRPQTDWRSILNGFVQEEIVDYSFTPPDRRFDECPFFLPDFNDKDDLVEDILFMIDTSGSMSDDMITAAYSEIKGAIDQYDGKLKGWLGFFDAAIVEPEPFESIEEFEIIRPKGGGGTDFQIIFEYIQANMTEKMPVSIIILTDGYAQFPEEKSALGIPVLWLLNNEKVKPPWGKVARITI